MIDRWDFLWIVSITLTAAGIWMIYPAASLVFLGLCAGILAYFGRPRGK